MDQLFRPKLPFKSFLPAIGWFICSFVLLTLPGNDLPQQHWLDEIQADKFVHVFMFAALVYLFYRPWRDRLDDSFRNISLIIAFLALDYGIAMEFVQKYLVPNRSFDVWDIVADAVGCLLPFTWAQKKIRSS